MTKILVVDDEKHLRTLYQSELKSEGYDVVVALDGQEAIGMLEREKPELIVLDIRMPGIDGLETMSRLLAKDHQVPIILNTAYSSYRDSFLSWSADAYVIKSSDLTELKAKIRQVLDERAAAAGRPETR
jgi:DNA-binding response OmpR family regulator